MLVEQILLSRSKASEEPRLGAPLLEAPRMETAEAPALEAPRMETALEAPRMETAGACALGALALEAPRIVTAEVPALDAPVLEAPGAGTAEAPAEAPAGALAEAPAEAEVEAASVTVVSSLRVLYRAAEARVSRIAEANSGPKWSCPQRGAPAVELPLEGGCRSGLHPGTHQVHM